MVASDEDRAVGAPVGSENWCLVAVEHVAPRLPLLVLVEAMQGVVLRPADDGMGLWPDR